MTQPLFRLDDLEYLLKHIDRARCVSVVGVSNMGKSTLLRDLRRAETRAALRAAPDGNQHFIYVDCNRMVDQTEHAFYELILRVLINELKPDNPILADELGEIYAALLNPPNQFHIPLSFSRALTTLIENDKRRSIFIFDEFDVAYEVLNARVFLNLRAIKDRYGSALTYVTATDRRLSHIRTGEQVDEFKELFGLRVHYVQPLQPEDARAYIEQQVEVLDAGFDKNDVEFVLNQSGGHPSLMQIVCRQLAAETGQTKRSDSEDWLIHRELRDSLRDDVSVAAECRKIWRDLTDEEQVTLEALFLPGGRRDAQATQELVRKGLLVENQREFKCFAALFEDFVHRRSAAHQGAEQGIRVDAESGEVVVNGRQIDTLTNLEFRLLLLLYGRLNKIVDKYGIVESVWGEDYVDEVYDSSIEKLVSRLRKKIEPDPTVPQFVVTVRGRGYKLVG